MLFRFTIAIEMSVLLIPRALNVIISLSLKVFKIFSLFFVMSFLSVMKFHFHISCCEVVFFPIHFTWLSIHLLNLEIHVLWF